MIVRRAINNQDITAISELGSRFFDESSNRRFTLRIDGFKDILKQMIDNQGWSAALMAYEGETLAGYILIYIQNDFTIEPIGELFQMYVRPEYRGTACGRTLVDAAMKEFETMGAKRIYALADTGIADGLGGVKMFANLWKKFGFEETGINLTREL